MAASVLAPVAAPAAVEHLRAALAILSAAAGDPRDVPLVADAAPLGIMDCVDLERLIEAALVELGAGR